MYCRVPGLHGVVGTGTDLNEGQPLWFGYLPVTFGFCCKRENQDSVEAEVTRSRSGIRGKKTKGERKAQACERIW